MTPADCRPDLPVRIANGSRVWLVVATDDTWASLRDPITGEHCSARLVHLRSLDPVAKPDALPDVAVEPAAAGPPPGAGSRSQ